jgi:DHA2 family multidrug resistance protein
MQRATTVLGATGQTLDASKAGLALLHRTLLRQALTLTFSDTFFALALCFIVALIAALFSKPFGNAAPPPDAH